ncbi:MAG TPA: hypothetical protein EYH35_05400 [Thiotrichaceae bacterium]|nr:hypothetical protein [Thiotrichaceae bacterium]
MIFRITLGVLSVLLFLGCNVKGLNHFTPIQSHYDLLKVASSNQNKIKGPYCCSGKTLIVRNKDSEPIGYINIFGWQGKAQKIQQGKVYSKLEILVSGIETTERPQPDIIQSRLLISAQEASPERSYRIRVGCVSYRFYDLESKQIAIKKQQGLYFKGFPTGLKVDVKVSVCHKN